MANQIAHRVKHTTKTGATETLRLYGAQDCDMAAMTIANMFGSIVTKVEAIDANAPRQWNEMDVR